MTVPSSRSTLAVLVSTAVLASLALVTTAAPAAAQTTCDGRVATITDNDGNDLDPAVGFIEGTDGPDVIAGSSGPDVINGGGSRDIICGFGQVDIIFGGPGNDRIFGGGGGDFLQGEGGKDTIFGFQGDDTISGGSLRDVVIGGKGRDTIAGGRGRDVLKGNGGSDYIRGNQNNDKIDGGAGPDDCLQNGGTGPVRNCERADLAVRVFCPAVAGDGEIDCRVRVRNLGPDATTYQLRVGEGTESGAANCVALFDEDFQFFAKLRAGGTRTRTYTIDCSPNPDSSERVEAEVDGFARDRRRGNDEDSDVIDLP